MTGTVWDSVGEIPDDRSLREAIRQRVEAAGTSFYWAMRLLPTDRRNGMYAIYAFCREVDDIADDIAPPAQKQAALADWHAEIDALYAGKPRHLVARALHEPIERYGLRRQDFHAVIDGMEMDAAQDIRAPDLATLDLYCGRVAGAVGHLSVHVFGDAGPAAHTVADHLGRALQLTNILRDLDEDARRGRLYLPREILDRHGIATTEPLAVLRHPALPATCRDVAALAVNPRIARRQLQLLRHNEVAGLDRRAHVQQPVVGWEQGRRRPEGPARALLKIAAENPKAVSAALAR